MIRPYFARLFALSAIACAGLAAAQSALPAAPARNPATAPPSRAADPAHQGLLQLEQYLDGIAAQDEASRASAVAAIHTRVQAEERRTKMHSQILALIGGLPERTPLNAKVMGETQAEGFRIRKVLFESQPNFFVTALLYVPDGDAPGGKPGASGGGSLSHGSKRPAILITPGHGATGKLSDAAMAATFARNGFIVLSYDPIGQGERLQYPDPKQPTVSLIPRSTGEHSEASMQPMLIGESYAKYEIWDAMRGVDYLASLPEVDAQRIGAFGCSGGGTVTALTSALDTRIAAIGTACYITSFAALLPTLGPQDAEQSTPRFISSGLDFADLVELAAPRAYAVVSTYSDMFPFAGTRDTVIEARRFYALFDPASAGATTGSAPPSVPPTPAEPALNADTTNRVSLSAKLQWITGPGGHGALQPIVGNILSFFLRNLQPRADADHPFIPSDRKALIASLPPNAFQVTPTGQVATSFPGCATVFTLNKKRAAHLVPAHRPIIAFAVLGMRIREATGAAAVPGATKFDPALLRAKSGPLALPSDGGFTIEADLAVPSSPGPHPAVLLVVPGSIHEADPIAQANKAKFDALAAQDKLVLAITPRPSPPGAFDAQPALPGPLYILSLRADLVGRSLVGLRADDVIHAIDYLAARGDVDLARISAQASGHMGLVLLHAGVLDRRIRRIQVDHVLTSYRSLLDAPLPTGAPEDVIPGVLRHYDIPDLERALKPRLTESDPLKGSDDLSPNAPPQAPGVLSLKFAA